ASDPTARTTPLCLFASFLLPFAPRDEFAPPSSSLFSQRRSCETRAAGADQPPVPRTWSTFRRRIERSGGGTASPRCIGLCASTAAAAACGWQEACQLVP